MTCTTTARKPRNPWTVALLVSLALVAGQGLFMSCDDNPDKADSDDYWNRRAPSGDYQDDDRRM